MQAVSNDFATDGMALLTAANMAGKSTLLRTVTAAALLANCGLCVPASSAVVPAFDVIFLRNTAYDAPKEGKSSFGVEMSDIRDLLSVVTPRSLVMVDELGKGTSSSEGAALSGAILVRACVVPLQFLCTSRRHPPTTTVHTSLMTKRPPPPHLLGCNVSDGLCVASRSTSARSDATGCLRVISSSCLNFR